jgi:thiosulfate dehydrogenase [quinone] large subunit
VKIASVEGIAALMFMPTGSRRLSIDHILYSKYHDGIKIGKI